MTTIDDTLRDIPSRIPTTLADRLRYAWEGFLDGISASEKPNPEWSIQYEVAKRAAVRDAINKLPHSAIGAIRAVLGNEPGTVAPDEAEAFVKAISTLSVDDQFRLVRQACKEQLQLVATPAFEGWCRENAALFNSLMQ